MKVHTDAIYTLDKSEETDLYLENKTKRKLFISSETSKSFTHFVDRVKCQM